MATPTGAAVALLSPAALPKVLGEALLPGVRVVTLLNRSGLLLGVAGDAEIAPSISAIGSSVWQSHEKCDGHGTLGCLLLDCEHGRLAIKAAGPKRPRNTPRENDNEMLNSTVRNPHQVTSIEAVL